MKNEFVDYKIALALKELGFDEDCFKYWYAKNQNEIPYLTYTVYGGELYEQDFNIPFEGNEISISAPLYQQAFRFFREKYNLRGFIGFRPNVKQFDYHIYDMSLSGKEYIKQRTMEEFNKDPKVGTYEEAELACLVKLIEIVK